MKFVLTPTPKEKKPPKEKLSLLKITPLTVFQKKKPQCIQSKTNKINT